MRIFKIRYFDRWATENGLTDDQIKKAVEEMERGLHDGNLGGYIYKKRISAVGRGKRGGLRTIIAHWLGDKAIFIYGYAKNVQTNVMPKELKGYKKLAKVYSCLSEGSFQNLLKKGELMEVLL